MRTAPAIAAFSLTTLLAACGADVRAEPARERDPSELAAELRGTLGDAPSDGLTQPLAIEDPTGHALDSLHAALERAARREGQARIVVYGGSHTASDLYTGAIRQRLQAAYGDAGHGFVAAVPPISRYWQDGARVADAEGWEVLEPSLKRPGVERYGLIGMAFEAREVARAEVSTDRTRASRIEVMYLRQPGGGELEVQVDDDVHRIDTLAPAPEAGVSVYAVPDGAHTVQLRTDGEGPVRVYGVVLEREGPGVIVDQLGVAGSKARHQLLWDEDVWRTLLRTRRPDFFVLSYGNNELDDHHLTPEQHEAHYARMLERLHEHFPAAGCLVLGPSDRRTTEGGNGPVEPPLLPFFREMTRRVALEHDCGFVDVLGWQGGPGAVERWLAAQPPLERDDGIHFTEAAYRRLGMDLLRAMLATRSTER